MILSEVLLAVLGIAGTLVVVGLLGVFIWNVSRERAERNCLLHRYYDWVMYHGTDEQKNQAQQFLEHRDLAHLKEMVGDGFLVQP